MSKDLDGVDLSVGDIVLVPCVVTALNGQPTHFNCSLRSVHAMPGVEPRDESFPGAGDGVEPYFLKFDLNTAQVRKE